MMPRSCSSSATHGSASWLLAGPTMAVHRRRGTMSRVRTPPRAAGIRTSASGGDDFLLPVAVQDLDHLHAFLLDRLSKRGEIIGFRTSVIYQRVHNTALTRLPAGERATRAGMRPQLGRLGAHRSADGPGRGLVEVVGPGAQDYRRESDVRGGGAAGEIPPLGDADRASRGLAYVWPFATTERDCGSGGVQTSMSALCALAHPDWSPRDAVGKVPGSVPGPCSTKAGRGEVSTWRRKTSGRL